MMRKLHKPPNSKTELNFDVPKPIAYFTTYFLGNVSRLLTNELKLLVGQFYPQLYLQILFKSSSTIGNSFSHKDKVHELTASNVIYKYTCKAVKLFTLTNSNSVPVSHRTKMFFARTGREVKCQVRSDK